MNMEIQNAARMCNRSVACNPLLLKIVVGMRSGYIRAIPVIKTTGMNPYIVIT